MYIELRNKCTITQRYATSRSTQRSKPFLNDGSGPSANVVLSSDFEGSELGLNDQSCLRHFLEVNILAEVGGQGGTGARVKRLVSLRVYGVIRD